MGAVNSSGWRSAEGSSCSKRQNCISRRASKVVGLSVALATESTVRGRLTANRDKGLPLLPSWCSSMTRLPSLLYLVEINGDVRRPCTADLRQLGQGN